MSRSIIKDEKTATYNTSQEENKSCHLFHLLFDFVPVRIAAIQSVILKRNCLARGSKYARKRQRKIK